MLYHPAHKKSPDEAVTSSRRIIGEITRNENRNMQEIIKHRKDTVQEFLKPLTNNPVITVDKVPDHRDDKCRLTLNIPWEMAYQIAHLASPFLVAISQSTDARTDWQRESDYRKAVSETKYYEKTLQQRRALYKALKRTHSQGLSYQAFRGVLDEQVGEACGDVGLSEFSNWQIRAMWGRIRRWSIEFMLNHGKTRSEVAKFYGMKPQNIIAIIKKDKANGK